jgi:hypothetical protein
LIPSLARERGNEHIELARQCRCNGIRDNEHIVLLPERGNADAMEYAATNIFCPYLSVATADAMEYAATNIFCPYLSVATADAMEYAATNTMCS